MTDSDPGSDGDWLTQHLYHPESGDPTGKIIDWSGLSADDNRQIARLMQALSALREAEQAVTEASERYMKLSAQQMRALYYLIIAKNRGEIATPGMISAQLGISAASTTKLLNRLERDGHIVRRVHPVDRRAFAIEITPQTEGSAMQTVGRHQARRLGAAARLTSEEREIVIRFLQDMTRDIAISNADWVD